MNTLEELETQENQMAQDTTGLAEMQNALKEIEKLKQINTEHIFYINHIRTHKREAMIYPKN